MPLVILIFSFLSNIKYHLSGKIYHFINISSESPKIVKYMDVKKQVLCIYKEYLVKILISCFNILESFLYILNNVKKSHWTS